MYAKVTQNAGKRGGNGELRSFFRSPFNCAYMNVFLRQIRLVCHKLWFSILHSFKRGENTAFVQHRTNSYASHCLLQRESCLPLFHIRTWRPYPFSAKIKIKSKLHTFLPFGFQFPEKHRNPCPQAGRKKTKKEQKKALGNVSSYPFFSFIPDPFFPLERKGKLHSANPHIFWPIFHQLQKDPRKRQVCTFSFPHKTRTVGKRGISCWVELGPKSTEVTPSGV